ncbi:hypothetical protein [Andreprevotia chitinilytica]|uniref:hypothetical protein n=1 Tax=Andreprevotia chitinilytica TaxID=396808 RepID=UPI0012EB7BD0|nr:hypothetical protein [Andreprevotia chitinilytica]
MSRDKMLRDLNHIGEGYYGIELHCREVSQGFWMARAEIRRADSNEIVSGVQRSGRSDELALDAVCSELPEVIQALPKPPHEWHRLKVRNLLVEYRRFNDEITSILVGAKQKLQTGSMSEEDLRKDFEVVRERAISGAVEIVRMTNLLSEPELLTLVESPAEVFNDLSNPRNLDDVDTRLNLFKFIFNPSDAVRAAHKRQSR